MCKLINNIKGVFIDSENNLENLIKTNYENKVGSDYAAVNESCGSTMTRC